MERVGRTRSFRRRDNILYVPFIQLLDATRDGVIDELNGLIASMIRTSVGRVQRLEGRHHAQPTLSGLHLIWPTEVTTLSEIEEGGGLVEWAEYQLSLESFQPSLTPRKICTRFRFGP